MICILPIRKLPIRDLLLPTLALVLSLALPGCASYMYGWTDHEARNQYLIVDDSRNSLGYRRLQYIQRYRGAAIRDFIAEKGAPNYILEYTEDRRDHMLLYYLDKEQAFHFRALSRNPHSMVLLQVRPLNDMERNRFGLSPRQRSAGNRILL